MPTDPWAEFRVAPQAAATPPPGSDPWASFRVAPQAQQAPETPFPTPMQTAGRVGMGALGAIPGMVKGAAQMAAMPLTAPLQEMGAMAGMNESPSMRQVRESYGHLKAASEMPAQSMDALGHVVSAVPVVGPAAVSAVKGAGKILTPAYKTATRGVSSVTPEEMNSAADAGGAGIMQLLAAEAGVRGPQIAGLASKAAGAVSGANLGKVLRFAAKGGAEIAGMSLGAPMGATSVARVLVGKVAVKVLTHPKVLSAGSALVDRAIQAARRGNMAEVAEATAKIIEKHPEIAADVAKAAAEIKVPAATKAPTYTAKMPEKGNVKMATVYTRPKADAPLTPRARNTILEDMQRQAAEDANLDLWDAFGIERPQ